MTEKAWMCGDPYAMKYDISPSDGKLKSTHGENVVL